MLRFTLAVLVGNIGCLRPDLCKGGGGVLTVLQYKLVELDFSGAVFITNKCVAVAVAIPARQTLKRVAYDGHGIRRLAASLVKHRRQESPVAAQRGLFDLWRIAQHHRSLGRQRALNRCCASLGDRKENKIFCSENKHLEGSAHVDWMRC